MLAAINLAAGAGRISHSRDGATNFASQAGVTLAGGRALARDNRPNDAAPPILRDGNIWRAGRPADFPWRATVRLDRPLVVGATPKR
jgi:hypothetical protein